MSQCYSHIATSTGAKRCPATATTYSKNGVPVCTAHSLPSKAVTK